MCGPRSPKPWPCATAPRWSRSSRPLGTCSGHLRFNGLGHAVVDAVVTHALDDAVPPEQFANGWLHTGQPHCHTGLLGEVEDLVHLRRSLRVDELDGDAIEHDP